MLKNQDLANCSVSWEFRFTDVPVLRGSTVVITKSIYQMIRLNFFRKSCLSILTQINSKSKDMKLL